MVNSVTPRLLSVYLNAGLGCDGPIIEAVCNTVSFNPRSVKEIGHELMGDQDRYPSLEKVKAAFTRWGSQCVAMELNCIQLECRWGNLQLRKSADKYSTKFALLIQPSSEQDPRFSLEWIIPRREDKQIQFVIHRSLDPSIQIHGQTEGATFWATVVAYQEML